MTIQHVAPKLINPNPWQTRRRDDPEHLRQLTESIRDHGLLQPPVGRANGKGYQLAFGHSRLDAYQTAKPGEAFPLDVREISDREMAEYAITENASRQDINPIDRARALKRYIDEFKVGQAEAGKLFGLSSQGAVSNVLRLLKLPEGAQAVVTRGQMSERLARQLVPIASVFESGAAKIAEQVAKSEPADKQAVLNREIEHLLRHKGRPMYNALWKLDWPREPIEVKNKSIAVLPACVGCEFFFNRDHSKYCGRPDCYDLKFKVYVMQYIVQVQAKALGLTAGAPGETVQVFFTGREREDEFARRALRSKHESLRLVPQPEPVGYDYTRERLLKELLGSSHVALASADLPALKKALPAEISKPTQTAARKPNNFWKKKQAEAEAWHKARRALLDRAAVLFAKQLPSNPQLLKLIAATGWLDHNEYQKAKTLAQQKTVAMKSMLQVFEDNVDRVVTLDKDVDTNEPEGFQLALVQLARGLKIAPPPEWLKPEPATAKKPKPKGKKK